MHQLERDYIFELAGMPRSGKTPVQGILAQYLKRMEYPLVEFNGGSRSSSLPIYRMPIGTLNENLAQGIEYFIRSIVSQQKSDHNIYLLDKGLIDRCIFTDALVQDDKVSEEQARQVYASLTDSRLLERLDGVFIFTVSPEIALQREYADKLVKREDVRSQGDVMNERFLRKMSATAKKWYKEMNGHIKYIDYIDTTNDADMQGVARNVFNGIRERYPELEFELTASR